jgi:TetR/AcrR family transcriptional repressor of mexJK operon
MPPRDDADYESKRQQIMDGALQVFATRGFETATNKDIAQAAGIGSPGLIYHYFKDKEDLFEQVLAHRAAVFQLLSRSGELMDRPPRDVLPIFAQAFVQMLENRTAVAVLKVMLAEAIRRPAVADVFNHVGPGRAFAFLSRYLARQMELGTLRRMDPGAAARCFAGPLIAYILTHEIFLQPDTATLSPEAMTATVVDIFLHGMETRDNLPPT